MAATQATITDDVDLAEHISKLPEELRDDIQCLVFTAKPGVRNITKTYKPPAQLQISRSTREKFASGYFGQGASFLLLEDDLGVCGVSKWACSVDEGHYKLLDKLYFVVRASPIVQFVVATMQFQIEAKLRSMGRFKLGAVQVLKPSQAEDVLAEGM